jgi:hypothetical protein
MPHADAAEEPPIRLAADAATTIAVNGLGQLKWIEAKPG